VTFLETKSVPAAEAIESTEVAPPRSQLVRWGLTSQDLLVFIAAALFCAGAGPFEFSGWTPRMAALLAALPLGVVVLVRMARRRDKAAIAALGFLAWALVGAVASGAPWRSVVGQVDGNTQSILIFCGVFGLWALARSLSDRGRALIGPVLVGALGLSALIGVLQIVLDIRSGSLAHVDGRAGGLEGNAALFSATLCGGCLWSASVSESAASARTRLYALMGVGFFALAIGLSGTRVSIIAIGATTVVVCWHARTLRSARIPAAILVGLGASALLQRIVQTGTETASRFATVNSGGRDQLWGFGLSALRDRPLLGWGVGRVRTGVQHHFTPDFVRSFQADDFSAAWNDVHNVVIQMLVSVGIVGFILLIGFVVFAFRKADFGLALAAVAISINWLLQPAGISSLAVAAIFLGASLTRDAAPDAGGRRWSRLMTASAVVIGLSTALALVIADLHLKQAQESGDSAELRAAAAWFGNDPFIADIFVMPTYRTDLAEGRQARTATARRMVQAEPDIPTWWNELAMTQWESGDLEGMRTSIEAALELQPNHVRSWVQMTAYAKRVGDTELEAIARTHACDLGAPVCAPG
jgi:O-antigen ligase